MVAEGVNSYSGGYYICFVSVLWYLFSCSWKICGFLAGICEECFWRRLCFSVSRTRGLSAEAVKKALYLSFAAWSSEYTYKG